MAWAHMSVVLTICSCDFTHFQLIVKGASCFSVSSFHLRLISMRLNFTAVWNSFETFCFSGALKTEEAFMTKLGPSPQRWGRLRSDGFHLWYVLVWAGGCVFRCPYLHVIDFFPFVVKRMKFALWILRFLYVIAWHYDKGNHVLCLINDPLTWKSIIPLM